ncbi:phosphogluconate dehydrogenase C-terminal domain-containing protein [Mesobacterium pallidum]|uniref:phosphogluconate dehydrogenase C-terminal domain-containing protein n=1 Tax=Mesobacterium pallidum TaxID=2872037 RepID=UPI001EE2AC63|nr:phosphogluconate dehydrogenase C-terminal domain-containing protein [Mesobacterium pallidum]
MTKIALFGAGGKMGVRLATNLKAANYDVLPVEVTPAGQERLHAETGLTCVEQSDALAAADTVILAVPDRLIGTVLRGFLAELKPGTAVIMLDAAAPHAGTLPQRDDVTYFVAHPCHPPLFSDETDPAAQKDYFGGIAAKQHIVCALAQGPEEHYAKCEAIARAFYAPVMRSHRVSVEQLAILEPALSETVGATFAKALKDATDEAARRGVPYQAAEDFLLGHMTILLATAFGFQPGGRLSDGCLLAIEEAQPVIFRDGWLDKVFAPEAIKASVQSICR